MSQEECARLRESVLYVKEYRYNPKPLYPKYIYIYIYRTFYVRYISNILVPWFCEFTAIDTYISNITATDIYIYIYIYIKHFMFDIYRTSSSLVLRVHSYWRWAVENINTVGSLSNFHKAARSSRHKARVHKTLRFIDYNMRDRPRIRASIAGLHHYIKLVGVAFCLNLPH